MSKATDDTRLTDCNGNEPRDAIHRPGAGVASSDRGGDAAAEPTAVVAPPPACPACGSADVVAEGATVGVPVLLVWWVNVPTRRTACARAASS